jgi:uncharacterized protein YlbG (UPF0298 family)
MKFKYDSLTIDGKEKYRVKYVAVDDVLKEIDKLEQTFYDKDVLINLVKKLTGERE